jgi:hypothetical protein
MTLSTKKQQGGRFASYMKHYGSTPDEQILLNKPLMEWLKKQLLQAENLTEEEEAAREQQWTEFAEILDSFRPQGHKLYTEE